MAFDGEGNLYITQRGTTELEYTDGSIYKITSDRMVSKWVDTITGPRDIVWTGGTSYGDTLFVAESNTRDILGITLMGNITTFSDCISEYPHALGIDRTGNYSWGLYTATRGTDRILKIEPDGSTSIFSYFPTTIEGGPTDLIFDITGNYDNLMYLAIADEVTLNGIYKVAPDGNATVFAPEITDALALSIDENGSMFNGDLFVVGSTDSWKRDIFRITPSGESSLFIQGLYSNSACIQFGSDGALYVADRLGDEMIITKVSVIPEPSTMSLFIWGIALVKSRKKYIKKYLCICS